MKDEFKTRPLEDLYMLSYRTVIIKLAIGSIGMLWGIFCISFDYIDKDALDGALPFINGVVCIISIICILVALIELEQTHINRKFLRLKNMDITNINSKSFSHSEIVNTLNKRLGVFFIIKNEFTVHKIGVSTHRDIDLSLIEKYYYLDEIRNGRIERTKYLDFNHFIEVLDQINGRRDTFDVVSVDKIVVPEKKKKS